jgi:acetolactate synthase-1/3 small subunit
VIRVADFAGVPHVEREMALVKVTADEKTRSEVMSIVDIFRGKVIDVSARSYIVEVTGDEGKIQALLELLRPLGILEIVRTGKVAMHRGARQFNVAEGDEKAA